jgi:hypothetical protein
MTTRVLLLTICLSIFSSCGDTNARNRNENSSSKILGTIEFAGTNNGMLVGDWLLYYIADDANGNRKLDGDEMANAVQHWGRKTDYRRTILHLDTNGESTITTQDTKRGRTEQTEKSRWEVKNNTLFFHFDKDGVSKTAVILKSDGKELQYVHTDEMIPGWIYLYKRP